MVLTPSMARGCEVSTRSKSDKLLINELTGTHGAPQLGFEEISSDFLQARFWPVFGLPIQDSAKHREAS